MFSKIKASFAAVTAIMTNTNSLQQAPAGVKDIISHKAPAHILTQYERATPQQALAGQFHVTDLETIDSDYLRNAVAQLGAWSSLARAFSEYERVAGRRTVVRNEKSGKSDVADDQGLIKLVDEFHAWNAATDIDKQMGEDAIALAADKMATVKPVKGNNQTDEIIARVRKVSVEDLRADRDTKAAKQTADRQELLTGFCSAIWGFTTTDNNPSLSIAKVVGKAVQTIEWIASSWTGSPESIAAELLIIEADIAKLERKGRQAEGRDEGQFVEGVLTSDGMMKLAEQNERQDRPQANHNKDIGNYVDETIIKNARMRRVAGNK